MPSPGITTTVRFAIASSPSASRRAPLPRDRTR
jgi:hypothetical protein